MARDKHIWVPTSEGAVARFLDQDEASVVSSAWHAIGRFLDTQDPEFLDSLKGSIVADVEIISDPEQINAYDEAGEWDVIDETIYVEKPK